MKLNKSMSQWEFAEWCKWRHDIYCNQKYGNNLSYSFHLEMVENQANRFKRLLSYSDFIIAHSGCYGHDLIEDTRITFGELSDLYNNQVVEIIYLCSENRGRTRDERKNDQFYTELATNRLAVFVKLSDVIANVKFSLLENSGMFHKAKREYPHLKQFLYREEFKEMFDYLELLFTIN